MLDAVRQQLPGAALVYCADLAGFPYGTKPEPEVSARVAGLLGRLFERLQPALMVIACNTASTIALLHVRRVIPCPIVGTVPAIKPAAALSVSRTIGVLGTEATVRQPYVDALAAAHAADCRVLRHGAPALVAAAEAKLRGGRPDPAAVDEALRGLLDQPGGDRLDTVVLACTHFALLREELEAASPRRLCFVDGAQGIARRVADLVADRAAGVASGAGRFLATGPREALAPLRPALQSRGLLSFETF